jgi:hypothetical protein
MCVDGSNTSPDDIAKFVEFVASMGEGALKEFLAPVAEALAEGGGFCLAVLPPQGEPPESGPPPGIYPI